MAVRRMDNVGIMVEDFDAAIAFFVEADLELEGRAPIERDWAGANSAVTSRWTWASEITFFHRHTNSYDR